MAIYNIPSDVTTGDIIAAEGFNNTKNSIDALKGGVAGDAPTRTVEEINTRTETYSDHGNLSGLNGDDHTQYSLVSGTRDFTGIVSYDTNKVFTDEKELVAKKYVDDRIPIASVQMYAGSSAPSGWLLCDGSAISRTTYSDLFTKISTTYGVGDGSTTFNLPDFRGVFPKGAGTTDRAAGKDAAGNFYAGTLGTYSQDQMQGHKHNPIIGYGADAGAASAWRLVNATGGAAQVDLSAYMINNDPSTDGTHGTPRADYTTEPQSLGINFIIKT